MPQSLNTVTISKLEYENLVSTIWVDEHGLTADLSSSSKRRIISVCLQRTHRLSFRFSQPAAKLKGSLLNGGLSQETLDVRVHPLRTHLTLLTCFFADIDLWRANTKAFDPERSK